MTARSRLANFNVMYVFFLSLVWANSNVIFSQVKIPCELTESNTSAKLTCQSYYYYNFLSESKDSAIMPYLTDGKIEFGLALIRVESDTSFLPSQTGMLTYYLSGGRMDRLNFKTGKLHGRSWSEIDGVLRAECQFVEGAKSGRQVHYDKKSGLVTTRSYVNGALNGPAYSTTIDSRRLVRYQQYENGAKSGLYLSFHNNNMLQTSLYYSDGMVIDGMYPTFYSEGEIKAYIRYREGVVVETVEFD